MRNLDRRTCVTCGVNYPARRRGKKFCSVACKAVARILPPRESAVCRKCGCAKPASEFYRNASANGIRGLCRTCHSSVAGERLFLAALRRKYGGEIPEDVIEMERLLHAWRSGIRRRGLIGSTLGLKACSRCSSLYRPISYGSRICPSCYRTATRVGGVGRED